MAAPEALLPGLSCSQQMHLWRDMSFWAMHASQSQLAAFWAATSCWKPASCLGAKPNLKLLEETLLTACGEPPDAEEEPEPDPEPDEDDDEEELEDGSVLSVCA